MGPFFFRYKEKRRKMFQSIHSIFDKMRYLAYNETSTVCRVSTISRDDIMSRCAVVNREHSTHIIMGQQVDNNIREGALNKICAIYRCDAYLSPSSLKKSPPRRSPPRSRKRKRGGNAGRSPPISRDAIVLSEIILR